MSSGFVDILFNKAFNNTSPAEASKQVAAMQQQTANNQLDVQKQALDYQKSVMDPYVQGGQQKYLELLQGTAPGGQYAQYGMDQYLNSPEYALYQSALDKQNQGIEAQAAASGQFGNPAVQNALVQATQAGMGANFQTARGNWMDDYNKLVGLANPNGAQQVANYAGNYAQNASNTMGNAANNIGNAMVNSATANQQQAGAFSNDLNTGINNFLNLGARSNWWNNGGTDTSGLNNSAYNQNNMNFSNGVSGTGMYDNYGALIGE